MGTTILLGQMIGCGKRKEAGDVIGGSICLFAALAVIVTALMFLVAVPFTKIMSTPEEAVSGTLSCFRIRNHTEPGGAVCE